MTALKTAPKLEIKPLDADVVSALKKQIAAGVTQSALAKELGVSPATVSNAVSGKFKGNPDTFSARVRGQFLKSTVQCPVLATITTKVCQDKQRLPFAATNPTRLALHKACPKCPHRNKGE